MRSFFFSFFFFFRFFLVIDECKNINPPCQQKCKNLKFGFECSCETGYNLADDRRSCEGTVFVVLGIEIFCRESATCY